MQRHIWGTFLFSLLVGAASARAQPMYIIEEPPPEPTRAYVEAFGNWGVNLGQTEYVPDGAPGESKHPFAKGFGAGVAVGVMLVPDWLSLFVDYRYGQASTREGEIDGVLTKAQGSVSFHEFTTGVRIRHPLGSGNMYAQLGAGVLFPFHTKREIEYAPELAAIGLVGEGTEKRNFGIGFGAQAELGYHWDLPGRLYLGTGIRIATFQSNNAGKDTELDNFVVDFNAAPPTPVNGEIEHSKGGPVRPTTYAIQDVRLNISLGYEF